MKNLAAFILLSLAAALAHAEDVIWKGHIQAGPQKLSVIVKVGAPDKATISIVEQNVTDTPLSEVKISDSSMTFRFWMAPMPKAAQADFTLVIDGAGAASGTMQQMGMKLPVTLTRARAREALGTNRPQMPKAPFGYRSLDVSFKNESSGGTLAGTLTLPGEGETSSSARSGAVVLITGSGPQDRDETLMGHKPFLVIADALTRAGVAVLRVDDPGVGASTDTRGENATTADYVTDALACIAFLKARPEIDASRIGLLGHSEGGIVAPMAAAGNPEVAFLVLLAGTGVPGREVLEMQLVAILRADGADEAAISRESALQAKTLEIVAAEQSRDAMKTKLAELAQSSATGDAATDAHRIQALSSPAITSPWMRTFVRLDPREALRRTKQPVLVINGAVDTQVIATQNIPEITKALIQAGSTDVTIRVLPGLNHLLQPARTGGVSEYAEIETTIDPGALAEIVAWVSKRASRPAPAPAR